VGDGNSDELAGNGEGKGEGGKGNCDGDSRVAGEEEGEGSKVKRPNFTCLDA
jgi:hypothetical protein